AAVSTRGRYLSQEDRARNPAERPLYLHIQAATKQAIDLAVQKIEEIIQQHQMDQLPPLSRPSKFKMGPPQQNMPPPLMSIHATMPSVEKVLVGLEHAPPSFDLRNKLIGLGGANLHYIRNETGAMVTLRGKGSGFVEPTTGSESLEPLHLCV
ncbi:hypothetical protein L9F63_013662, partial [Diploptera punctata]